MNDVGPYTCHELRENGAELALGVLPARERAAAVAHLQHCSACREHVRELARTVDGLVDLVPGCEPPVGFEGRVLERIGLPSRRSRHRRLLRRAVLAMAAVVAAFALALGGWAVGRLQDSQAPTASGTSVPNTGTSLLTGTLTSAGRSVGEAFAHTGASPWLYVALDADAVEERISGTVRCQIERADGSTATVGTFRVSKGYAHWGSPYPAGTAPITAVHLLAADGSVLATSSFPAPHR
ncbi:hypothetical protein [Streptomyces sp. NPDC002889]|uniref:hypothetical protein n=1 Tax=Streptomyces sp. NPDC002889 TaxID=3364669 RepID=UPI0036B18B7E